MALQSHGKCAPSASEGAKEEKCIFLSQNSAIAVTKDIHIHSVILTSEARTLVPAQVPVRVSRSAPARFPPAPVVLVQVSAGASE